MDTTETLPPIQEANPRPDDILDPVDCTLIFDHQSKQRLTGWLQQLHINDLRLQCSRLGLAITTNGQSRSKEGLVSQLVEYLLSFNDPNAQHRLLRGRLLDQVERWLAYSAVLNATDPLSP